MPPQASSFRGLMLIVRSVGGPCNKCPGRVRGGSAPALSLAQSLEHHSLLLEPEPQRVHQGVQAKGEQADRDDAR